MIALALLNRSSRRGLYTRRSLETIARRVAEGEEVAQDLEVSVLFCDDAEMAALNRQYRGKRGATDVLAFEQESLGEGPGLLGDIVISLETVERRNEDIAGRRADVRMLFCHGLLHLLGYDHETREEQAEMVQKQAQYLKVTESQAWRDGRGAHGPAPAKSSREGGKEGVGRRQ